MKILFEVNCLDALGSIWLCSNRMRSVYPMNLCVTVTETHSVLTLGPVHSSGSRGAKLLQSGVTFNPQSIIPTLETAVKPFMC
jgi:hypothetical protein